ncbi:hypothetical protein CR513_57793, partial [Mucuna pruriens]
MSRLTTPLFLHNSKSWWWTHLTTPKTHRFTYKLSKCKCISVGEMTSLAASYSLAHREGDLVVAFVSQFVASRAKQLKVDDPDQKFFVKAFQKGLKAGLFSNSLALRKLASMGNKHVESGEDKEDQLHVEREVPTMVKKVIQEEWCEFHRVRGHTTESCHVLKNQIEKMIQDGYLSQFVKHKEDEKMERKDEAKRDKCNNTTPLRDNSYHIQGRGERENDNVRKKALCQIDNNDSGKATSSPKFAHYFLKCRLRGNDFTLR